MVLELWFTIILMVLARAHSLVMHKVPTADSWDHFWGSFHVFLSLTWEFWLLKDLLLTCFILPINVHTSTK